MSAVVTKENFGENVRMNRLKKRIPQHLLAEHCGVKQSNISMIERGESSPSLELAIKLSIALGISLDELVSTKYQ